jgi:transposase
MPPHHRFIAEWSPERFLSWAAKVGPQTRQLIAEVLRKPTVVEQSFRTCMGILKLADRYEAPRLEAACCRALNYGIYKYRGIRTILEKGLDRTTTTQRQLFIVPNHENIRGGEYYAEASSGGQG